MDLIRLNFLINYEFSNSQHIINFADQKTLFGQKVLFVYDNINGRYFPKNIIGGEENAAAGSSNNEKGGSVVELLSEDYYSLDNDLFSD